jgi:hypothetical protein
MGFCVKQERDEWLVKTMMSMYECTETAVRTDSGLAAWFWVGSDVGSALSLLLCITVTT